MPPPNVSPLIKQAQECIASQSQRAHLNAFISVADNVVESVREIENNASTPSQNSRTNSQLAGRLIAIKDNICTSDLFTTAASGTLKGFRSLYDATVVKLLKDAGAVICGKTNLDEFGMGSHSAHSYFGSVQQENGVSTGGSSGGSAIAVERGLCWAALGTDTGGSVRLPAAYTGAWGFKPSYGLISRWGIIDYANSLDTVGILASSPAIIRIVFNELNKHDPQDPTNLSPASRKIMFSSAKRKENRNLRVGVPKEYNIKELDPLVRKRWSHTLALLRSTGGCSIHTVSLPHTKHALPAYYILAPAEASSNLAKYDGVRYGTRSAGPDGTPASTLFAKTRGEGFGEEVRRRILLGAFSLSSEKIDNYFIAAQRIRRLVQSDFNTVFKTPNPLLDPQDARLPIEDATAQLVQHGNDGQAEKGGVDVVICPTAPSPPPKLQDIQNQRPVDEYVNDVFTVPASLAGLPALSVPVKASDPESGNVGIQIIGQFGDDDTVLGVADILEEVLAKS